MNVELINPFLVATKQVMSQVIGVDCEIGKPYIRKEHYTDDHILILLGVTGQVNGHVILSYSVRTALEVASKMCMMEMTEMSEIAQSAVCELGNMILGNAATVLSSNDIIVDITSPSIMQGNLSIKILQTENVCIPFTFEGDRHLEVTVCLKKK